MPTSRFQWLYRSFRIKALAVATLSLALVVAVLFAVSTTWLKRERLRGEQQEVDLLLRYLATSLRLGVTVESAELIRPAAESAILLKEVKAIAIFGEDGTRLVQLEEESGLLSRFRAGEVPDTARETTALVAGEPWKSWVLGIAIDKELASETGAAPADFQVVAPEDPKQRVGTILVYWDLSHAAERVAVFQREFLRFAALTFFLVATPTWLLTIYLNRGFSELLVATDHVQRGDFRYRIGSRRQDELGDIMRAFDSMMERTAQTTDELQEQRERAVAASRAKSDFLANMSHELRTPLNAVIGFAELLLEPVFGSLSEKQKSYAADILESGRHLLSLINDILDLAKIEAGKMDLELETIDLPDLLAKSLRFVRERATKHHVALTIDVDGRLKWMQADQRKLKQVMFNLLSNAVKFTPDGGRVGIRAWPADDSVMICVWDTGIGVPEGERAKIFHDFYQVGDPLVKAQQGTGLGLSLVKKITELHGGEVTVESEVGQGSRFFVRLPLGESADREEAAAEVVGV